MRSCRLHQNERRGACKSEKEILPIIDIQGMPKTLSSRTNTYGNYGFFYQKFKQDYTTTGIMYV